MFMIMSNLNNSLKVFIFFSLSLLVYFLALGKFFLLIFVLLPMLLMGSGVFMMYIMILSLGKLIFLNFFFLIFFFFNFFFFNFFFFCSLFNFLIFLGFFFVFFCFLFFFVVLLQVNFFLFEGTSFRSF